MIKLRLGVAFLSSGNLLLLMFKTLFAGVER